MEKDKAAIDQRIKCKARTFNKQRIRPIAAFSSLLILFVLLSPAMGYKVSYIHVSITCFVIYCLSSVAFILSFRQAIILFSITTIVMAVALVIGQAQRELYFMLTLINAAAALISQKMAGDFIKAATNELEALDRLQHEATTDYLTQLLNRNGLDQALETAWAFCKRHKKRVGFLMVDIDYFKSYNDALGHLEGDNILKQIADSINLCFKRDTDIIGRIGGEEFLIFLSDIDDGHIIEMAQALSSTVTTLKIKAPTENNPCEFLSISIGISTGIPRPHDPIIDLCKQADRAMYHAKKNGRNCISFNGNIIRNPDNMAIPRVTVPYKPFEAGKGQAYACKDSEN